MTDDRQKEPLWTPDAERIASTEMDRFRKAAAPQASGYDELWEWSVDEPGEFWRAIWDDSGVIGDPGQRLAEPGSEYWEHRFLPDATLNYAENLLAARPGADELALICLREDGTERFVDRDELRAEVGALADFFRSCGVVSGDRVAAWMPHIPETIIAFLAASSIGAVFTSTSADFGPDGVVDRFGQTEPKLLIAADGYLYGGKEFDCLNRLGEIVDRLPSVTDVVVVDQLGSGASSAAGSLGHIRGGRSWAEAVEPHRGAELVFEPLPFDHPIYILYSSGTTGKPKCIVHRAGGVLLKHLSEIRLHCDVRPGDRVFFFTTCGWMMWNWLVSGLAAGATLVLYDGNPAHPAPDVLFDLADRHQFTLFGVSAKFIDSCMKSGLTPRESHELGSVRTICSTGSPLSDEGFEWVYGSVKSNVHLSSMSGGTDLCGCLVAGDPTRPVRAGEIQVPNLGLRIEVLDDEGQPLQAPEQGELTCATPFPSMPIEFWGDSDGSRYRSAYFDRFPGVWAHGDFASWTNSGGMVIHGRSDATLNSSGVRIGTAEIYGVVEQLDEVIEAIAVGQLWDNDTRIVLFLRLADGVELTEELERRVRSDLRSSCSPRHVPAIIKAVADIPRTRSGKIVELAVTEVIHGRTPKNLEALANPEALELFSV